MFTILRLVPDINFLIQYDCDAYCATLRILNITWVLVLLSVGQILTVRKLS